MTRTTGAIIPVAAGLLALGLAGCAGDVNPVRDVFVGVGAGATPNPAPDFIAQSRPTAPADYLPIRPVPERAIEAKTPEEVAALEAELVLLRERQAARAASTRRLTLAPAPEPVVVDPVPAPTGDVPPPVRR